jgi:hypothetical protein
MTDTATAPDGLEKRLRKGENFPPLLLAAYTPAMARECEGLSFIKAADAVQAADALAKARVALEEITKRYGGFCGVCDHSHSHEPTCPIGAALEAMK